MTILKDVLLLAHFIGWAALFGGMVVQVREPLKRVNAAMRDGAGLAFVAGLLIVGVLEAGTEPVDHLKVAVKFVVALVVLVLVMANTRKERIPGGVFFAILGLTLLNMVVAIFW